MPEITKPFKDDPAKQERYEQFLKEKYQGGLRSTHSGGASHMSEAARARERLDFEAAADAIEKGKWGKQGKLPTNHITEYLATGGMQFTSGGLEVVLSGLFDVFKFFLLFFSFWFKLLIEIVGSSKYKILMLKI